MKKLAATEDKIQQDRQQLLDKLIAYQDLIARVAADPEVQERIRKKDYSGAATVGQKHIYEKLGDEDARYTVDFIQRTGLAAKSSEQDIKLLMDPAATPEDRAAAANRIGNDVKTNILTQSQNQQPAHTGAPKEPPPELSQSAKTWLSNGKLIGSIAGTGLGGYLAYRLTDNDTHPLLKGLYTTGGAVGGYFAGGLLGQAAAAALQTAIQKFRKSRV